MLIGEHASSEEREASTGMTSTQLIWRSATHHWRTNLAVVAGVAAAVSVLSGALLVGNSVRGSLRDLALSRLGRTQVVIASTDFFREGLAADIQHAASGTDAAPMLIATGFATHEPSGRRASSVFVYGIDERFWAFHGTANKPGVLLSPALQAELGADARDVILLRLQKPSAIPIESLFGRKDDVARTVRLTVDSVLPNDELGEFSLQPRQSEVRAIFLPLIRVQRDLGLTGRVNTILATGSNAEGFDATIRRAAALEDLGATVAVSGSPENLVVESHSGIMGESLEAAVLQAGAQLGWRPIPVFTYLANTIRRGDRQIPYSLIAATDLGAVRASSSPTTGKTDQIILNDWAARELDASPGDTIAIDYFLWDTATGLTTHSAEFTLARVVPIAGLAADQRLAPQYPGITAAISLADWDPPFPVDLSRVRPQDEAYWKQYRTTPKAFVDFTRGQQLWKTRFGASTSVRFAVPDAVDAVQAADRLRSVLRPLLPPQAAGVTVRDVRREALAASAGATDFGEYFTYFSFFIVASALLLTLLFFRLGVEQRLREIGILRATGFTTSQLRRLLVSEALALAIAGSVIGMAGAWIYGRLIIFGLRTWWVGAVGTTQLSMHVSSTSLAIGALAGVVTAIICVAISLRSVARLSPRLLLTAHTIEGDRTIAQRSRRIEIVKWILAAAGTMMLAAGFTNRGLRTGMFFGAGAALLAASMCQVASSLRARHAAPIAGRGTWPLWRLGFRSAAFRPSRSVMSIALIASAAFIIVAVDAFRRGETPITDIHSGTGGFALLAQSEVPILADPNQSAGREALVVNAPDFSRVKFTRFRLRPGDDASCLNLYRPTAPTIIAPEPGFIESGRFSFASSLAATDAERANPWLLLQGPMSDAIPVIADATSLEYVLHAGVGDTFSMDNGAAPPIVFRFVGAIRDSVLQGQLIMSEQNFTRLFPAQQGYRFFLIEDPSVRSAEQADQVAGVLETELAPFGFDAVSTAERLAAFHRVENTYLSTFQALGGLGLLLGTIGLSAIMFRNVLERRRELALLGAVGYDSRRIATMIAAEASLLVGAGVLAGTACAAIAVAPAWFGHGGSGPGIGLLFLLAAVIFAGLASSVIAVRAALRGRLVSAISSE
jgi:putative ABC transport system permease protein